MESVILFFKNALLKSNINDIENKKLIIKISILKIYYKRKVGLDRIQNTLTDIKVTKKY